jgi:N-acetylglutamate synthase-like GNAT family acetyltransferase
MERALFKMSGQFPARSHDGLALRQAQDGDVAAITRLINEAFQVERFFLAGDRITSEEVRRRMERGIFLLLEDSGALAGCVYSELRGDSGFVGLLAVEPQWQKSGLSRALMAAAEEYFRANGCRQAELRVVNLRPELPPYYRHLGYQETATEKFPAEIPAILPCHLIVMTKGLI